ncbi:hypothetical protein MXD60_00950, partial [Frankia sp. AgB32]|nr:hypothetical protein [Frankia sp. AgB32]
AGTTAGPAGTNPGAGAGAGSGAGGRAVPGQAGGAGGTSTSGGASGAEDPAAGTAAATGGQRASGPSTLVWIIGLGVAVWFGGLLGVGAHLLAARPRRRRPRSARADRAVAPYPSPPLVRTDRVPAATGGDPGHS